jgi:hypothetical protein
MALLVQQTAHQFQLRPVSQKKRREILSTLSSKTNQAVQMPTIRTAWQKKA